ncbi:TetR/AcrR family transcriptional regulator [Massilia sp. H6]|uniref:TetR/AcrR family transcriptional regulator n=1 Tax=Massilia sp. H6 TaxID=2970464 RepID=UPI0021675AC5|nr:TetR/AcrR family transcriptional regulator [Massilia sp. H6]UVW29317.1 TetR/AcrR family transcriptional regulator [Massilia sp. H6]
MKPTSPMVGRPRQFVPREALRNALEVFWGKGYQATSLDDLTAAMHLSRSSFYACFGSKHAVMMAAVELYADELFARLEAMASSLPALEAVHAVLAAIAAVDAGHRGCFFVNCVTELAPHDAALAAFGQRHVARTGKLVAGLLERAGLPLEMAQTRAAALLALVIGAITLRKAGLPASELMTILNQAQLLIADTTSSI